MFIFGGINQHQRKFNDMHEYNVVCKQWCLIETSGMIPSPRTFHQLTAVDNRLFLIGGSSTEKLNDVHSMAIYNLKDLNGRRTLTQTASRTRRTKSSKTRAFVSPTKIRPKTTRRCEKPSNC